MNCKKWMDVLEEPGFGLSAGTEITAANLLAAEICSIPPGKRRCYMERFVSDSKGGIRVDYEALVRELCRIAKETCNELDNMERAAGSESIRQEIAIVRTQLCKENFASLKNEKNPVFMRVLADLYRNL